MKFQTEKERAIRAALYRIAMSSKQATRFAWTDAEGKARSSNSMTFRWHTAEQDLIWSIYERAVFDEAGLVMRFMGKNVTPIPNDTARTGLIRLPSGRQVNILELLGIDPEWARNQIDAAHNYMLKQAA